MCKRGLVAIIPPRRRAAGSPPPSSTTAPGQLRDTRPHNSTRMSSSSTSPSGPPARHARYNPGNCTDRSNISPPCTARSWPPGSRPWATRWSAGRAGSLRFEGTRPRTWRRPVPVASRLRPTWPSHTGVAPPPRKSPRIGRVNPNATTRTTRCRAATASSPAPLATNRAPWCAPPESARSRSNRTCRRSRPTRRSRSPRRATLNVRPSWTSERYCATPCDDPWAR